MCGCGHAIVYCRSLSPWQQPLSTLHCPLHPPGYHYPLLVGNWIDILLYTGPNASSERALCTNLQNCGNDMSQACVPLQ